MNYDFVGWPVESLGDKIKRLEKENAALRERVRNAEAGVVDEKIRKGIWNEGYAEGLKEVEQIRRELAEANWRIAKIESMGKMKCSECLLTPNSCGEPCYCSPVPAGGGKEE